MRWIPCLLVLLVTFAGCARGPRELVLSGPTMGTTYTVKVVGKPDDIDAEQVRLAIDDVLTRIDVEMSIYRNDSAIARFNAERTTEWVDVPHGLAFLVSQAQRVSERSDGAFDITVAPLIAAWGFGPGGEPERMPSEMEIAALRDRVGNRRLEARLDPAALRKQHPELAIDVNGVAPGYAVDVLAARFEAMGLRDFMVDIGGEVLARGRNAAGSAWRIAVERPEDTEPRPFAILELDNQSVTTSGEYRHYYERDGVRYSHTIDPRSGHPIAARGSVVVVGATSLEIDAWATALNVLGPQAGLALADAQGLAVMYLVVEGDRLTARKSKAFEREVRMTVEQEK